MRISISNLAWDLEEEEKAAQIMIERGISGVEIAPTKIWGSLSGLANDQILEYRRFWESRNIQIVALQALLFGKPELTVFQDDAIRERTIEYLTDVIKLASTLGARILVFGSPKNRLKGNLDEAQVLDIAVPFFRRLGEIAFEYQTCFCIEPNATVYGCDFVRTAQEGLQLVRLVDHPGFRLHLDSGVMTLNGEDYGHSLDESIDYMEHFHISEPQLGLIGSGLTRHAEIAPHLRRLGYGGWISIEMRNGWLSPNTNAVSSALDFVRRIYLE